MTIVIQSSASLIPWSNPVVLQGTEGTCDECGTTNLIGTMSNLYGHPFTSDAQFQYDANLAVNHELGTDFGTYPVQALQLAQTIGLTQNADIPYGVASDGITPSAADYADAATHTITGFVSIDTSTQENVLSAEIAGYLNQGKPLEIAFNVCAGLSLEVAQSSLTAQSGMDTGAVIGGHVMIIDAINTATNTVTCQSWGTPYGDNGYFNISLDSFYGSLTNELNLQGIYAITGFNGINLTQNAATAEVASAYVGLLARAPELSGMNFWEGAINSGMTLTQLCAQILGGSEAAATMGAAVSNTTFLDNLYQNVLGRQPDAGGLAFWGGALSAGTSRASVAASIITAGIDARDWAYNVWVGDGTLPGHPANSDPGMMTESLTFNNKIIAAQDFSIILQAPDGYSAVAHNYILSITADPGTITANLVGVPEQIGHAHVVAPVL